MIMIIFILFLFRIHFYILKRLFFHFLLLTAAPAWFPTFCREKNGVSDTPNPQSLLCLSNSSNQLLPIFRRVIAKSDYRHTAHGFPLYTHWAILDWGELIWVYSGVVLQDEHPNIHGTKGEASSAEYMKKLFKKLKEDAEKIIM